MEHAQKRHCIYKRGLYGTQYSIRLPELHPRQGQQGVRDSVDRPREAEAEEYVMAPYTAAEPCRQKNEREEKGTKELKRYERDDECG